MKQTLPIYGVFAAIAAIAGLGFLASQLIFSDGQQIATKNKQEAMSQQLNAEIRADLGKQLAPSRSKVEESYAKPDVVDTSSDLLQGTKVKPDAADTHKSSMVPGSALRNKELNQMTGVYGTKKIIPKVVTPSAAQGQAAAGQPAASAQGFFSKLFYGDRVKIAAEKRAKEKAAYEVALKKRMAASALLIEASVKGSHRKDYKVKRDIYRHPKETLLFFGLLPEMHVIEMWPGEGWYSEIIAPVLKGKGVFYAASWDSQLKTRAIDAALKRYTANFVKKPEIFGKVVLTSLSERRFDIGADNSADFIFSSRNMYSWMRKKMDGAVFNAMFRALKPGGILGIVDHRQAAGTYQDPRAMSGYVTESHVIEVAKRAGFVFVGKSEINANPKDYRKYPRGVFSLPPVLKEGKRHKKKYLAIGESDRMTLKFMKPKV